MQATHRWVVAMSGKTGHDAGRTVMIQSRMTARRPAATVLLIAMLFNGESPNPYWGVFVEDVISGDTGVLDFINLEIYYSSASLLKQALPVTGKTALASNDGAGRTISSRSEDNRLAATASDAVEQGGNSLPAGLGHTGSKP